MKRISKTQINSKIRRAQRKMEREVKSETRKMEREIKRKLI